MYILIQLLINNLLLEYVLIYSLSLQPFANPYCTKEGVVFDLL